MTSSILRYTIVLTGILSMSTTGAAQTLGFKEHEQLAARFTTAGDYLKAAEQNAAAYEAKPRKTEYAYAAAEQFYLVKDYARAAKYYQLIARDYKAYPLAGLRYARSLKQDGKFSEATAAYLDYLSYYQADDRALIEKIVEQEVQGAELARQAQRSYNVNVLVEPFSTAVNTPGQETAPMPLAPGALYFLSDEKGTMRMYRSFEQAGRWSTAEPAGQFPILSGKHIGPGALSPLADRYYFSLCDAREVMTQPTAKCQIHVILRRDTLWSVPQALPPYINTADNSTSHPFVYRDGNLEVLLFASDRLDGHGGMDLYRAERYLNSEATDFSFPQNLGPVVNGVGDEVSPYYDPVSQTLYFSTNGGISMGGYDVFQTLGGKTGYNTPTNLGAPINSPADDYYYRQIPGTPLAVLASNRALRDAKTRTNNEDIYLVKPGTPTLEVSLQVVDSSNELNLREVVLAAYVIDGDEQRRLLYTDKSEDGFFKLALPLDSEIELDVQRLDYRRVQQRLTVPKGKREGFQLPRLRMSRIVLSLSDVQQIEDTRTDKPVATLPSRPGVAAPASLAPAPKASAKTDNTRPQPTPASNPSTSAPSTPSSSTPSSSTPSSSTPSSSSSGQGTASAKLPPAATPATQPSSAPIKLPENSVTVKPKPEPTVNVPPAQPALSSPATSSTRSESTTPAASSSDSPVRASSVAREYRIQIEARQTFEPESNRYKQVTGVGALSSDYVEGKSIYRILVGRYTDIEAAKRDLDRVKSAGFRDAFVAAFDFGSYRGMARN